MEKHDLRVAMLGSFPPQAQGVQDYCREIGLALARQCRVHGIGFRRMYPALFFPGVKRALDPTKSPMRAPNLILEHRLTWHNPAGWLRAGLATPCDVFHAQWWSLPLFPVTWTMARAMRLRGKPVVVTVHNVLPHEGGGAYLRASRRLCRLADMVIVHSEANLEQLRRHYGLPAEKTARVPLGSYMADAPKVAADEARRQLGLPADKRYILSFGTIRPYKGIDTLIEALAQLPADCADAHLVVAGKPWMDWAPCQRLIAERGLAERVHLFLDYIPEERVPLFFGAADVAALPYTHFDAQSGVGAVALPYRKPLIVSETGGLPDWVDHDPAWMAPPSDPAALSARLAAFFREQPARAAAFGGIADRVLARLSWDGIATQHLEIYERLQ